MREQTILSKIARLYPILGRFLRLNRPNFAGGWGSAPDPLAVVRHRLASLAQSRGGPQPQSWQPPGHPNPSLRPCAVLVYAVLSTSIAGHQWCDAVSERLRRL